MLKGMEEVTGPYGYCHDENENAKIESNDSSMSGWLLASLQVFHTMDSKKSLDQNVSRSATLHTACMQLIVLLF